MSALDQITLTGFKSIRELTDFKLEKLNVLVGANGAGKSNLVDFFRMLRAMSAGGVRAFVTTSGGADGFFFNGPKETKQISAQLRFGRNRYRFALESTVAGKMMIREEATVNTERGEWSGDWHVYEGGMTESRLKTWNDRTSRRGDSPAVEAHVYDVLASWMVYHFHDTSNTAPMRRDCSARDFRELRSDAGNIAAFLLKMREENGARYQRSRETVQLIAPFFDDFLLEPQM